MKPAPTNYPIGLPVLYRLEISLAGFGSYVQTGIVLQVGEANPTINQALTVGDLAETVTVEASTPLVDVRSAGISDVVENERIVELPLQGRQVTSLLILAGAAVDQQATSPRYNPGGVSISVGGGLGGTASPTRLTARCTTTRTTTSTFRCPSRMRYRSSASPRAG